MTIQVTADSMLDLVHQLGRSPNNTWNISISFRENFDFHLSTKIALPGCIVDATRLEGEEVPLKFEDAKSAVKYLGMLLERRDLQVEQERTNRENRRNSLKYSSISSSDGAD